MQKPKALKVLSIDFDYFQNVDMQTLMRCYPDGIDLPTDISSMVWAGYYANPKSKKLLDRVTILQNELDALSRILSNNLLSSTPVMITNSHVHAYDFICDMKKATEADIVKILNIDMHHDIYNDSDTLDCGNWVSHILDEFKGSTLSWVANPISFQYCKMQEELKKIVMHSVTEIKDCKFDAVFLCRSDNWLAPHLDIYFDRLVSLISRHFKHALIE